jgi:hypothetical protein
MAHPPAVVGQVEPLQLPDVRRLEQMPSWPVWVASRIGLLRTEAQPDPTTGRWREVPTLPKNSTLTAAEREELARHARQLGALCQRTPVNDPNIEQETLVAVTKMTLVLPSMTQNDISAEARGEAFMAALDDVPVWAVQAAIRSWYRRNCGKNDKGEPYDYHWCPAPAELRCIALAEMRWVNQRANMIQTLLRAEPRIEYSDEHRRAMCDRFAELSRTLRASPVGKDGSGGGISAS